MELRLEMGEEPFGVARTLPFCALRKLCQNDLFFFLSHFPAVRNSFKLNECLKKCFLRYLGYLGVKSLDTYIQE